jgi:hypothetical protein
MKKTCFFIGPIGNAKTPTRDWSDQVLEYIITPAVTELGYEAPKRADQIPGLGSITFEIMRRLVEDDLVVADLTEGNPNAFYELAIRHALKKPVIHIIREGEKIPFDVRDIPVISVRIDNLREAEKVKQDLKLNIQAVESSDSFVIPYIDRIDQLKQVFESPRSNAEKENLINILERLDNIRFSINDLKIDLATLLKQTTYTRADGPSTSTFVDKRLAKTELIKKQQNKNKKKK